MVVVKCKRRKRMRKGRVTQFPLYNKELILFTHWVAKKKEYIEVCISMGDGGG